MHFRRLDRDAYAEKYADWAARVDRMHHDFTAYRHDPVAWTPLRKPLSECRVALATTAGVHRRSDEPFDQYAREGDPSFRVIEDGDASTDLVVSHNHFDHSDADRDINCIFPKDRLRELAADGVIGSVSPVHVGFMGFNPNPFPVRDNAVKVAGLLADAAADVVILTPG